MFADYVKCNWCDSKSYIQRGNDSCPVCNKEGFLQWVDEDNQEVEINEELLQYYRE
ncbi:hypothetical protein [Clostridium botulinum]|uniref:hypothetical protein n=1 Tax=Clostridium botulinum TaxID=1491 RepID=UPI0004D8CF4C|nr:hypothetical protein [Clostridium botulinum]KEH99726.1 hypothetical protein Z952_p0050 [Clostridium botulinum C/D str. BKT75002]KEI05204.1 putative phage protein [Clostridium botulinum C/D str. BKT2873]QPW62097.1 hypothetical protein IG390_13650 [Clostridium botulinum]